MSNIISPNGAEFSADHIQKANEAAEAAAFLRILRTADDLACEKCGGLNFIQVVRLKRVSGLQTGTGKDSLIPIPVYACGDCGHVNKLFLAKLDVPEEKPVPANEASPEVPEKGIE